MLVIQLTRSNSGLDIVVATAVCCQYIESNLHSLLITMLLCVTAALGIKQVTAFVDSR